MVRCEHVFLSAAVIIAALLFRFPTRDVLFSRGSLVSFWVGALKGSGVLDEGTVRGTCLRVLASHLAYQTALL